MNEQEIVEQANNIGTYLPYIVTFLCSVISGIISYLASRKQAKEDIKKLEKQHELNLQAEREKFNIEKERMQIEHNHQLELKEKEMENQLGMEFVSTLTKEYMKTPEARAQLRNAGITRKGKRK